MVNLYPTICNICGGRVIYTKNSAVYHGKQYGSGHCYLCQNCGAYVGTHISRPREAFGILSNERMRKGKKLCHEIFDSKWKNAKSKKRKKRNDLYYWLSRRLSIPLNECHFGYFGLQTLRRAYRILLEIKDAPLIYDCKGNIINGMNREEFRDGQN